MAVGLFGSAPAAGQTKSLGAGVARFHAAATPKVSPDPIIPFETYTDASYGTGGIALRNVGTGVLHVSGVTGRVQDAYLYWSVLFSTTQPTKALSKAYLSRVFPYPTFIPVALQGTLLGIGEDPNWSSNGAAVYRAQVPKWIATGNGDYQVTIASGRTDGSDPWVSSLVFPLAEGASMVIVGTGDYTVGIYDAGFTAHRICATETFTYTLAFPAPVTTDALWDDIGADGQTGSGPVGRDDVRGVTSETTTINTTLVAGPGTGTFNPDSDWNGNAGFPLPELWDDTGHDIFTAVVSSPNAAISIYSPGDCLVTVFNVLAVN
jgi:hypothetical protein